MAIAFLCDGCAATIPRHVKDVQCSDFCPGCRLGHEGTAFGRLDPVHYCADCTEHWRTHENTVTERRLQLVRTFEAWLREAEQDLGKTLKRLPDV